MTFLLHFIHLTIILLVRELLSEVKKFIPY